MKSGNTAEDAKRERAPVSMDEGAIEELFGQLWYIPSESNQVRVGKPTCLVWIRKELVENRGFTERDCYPATRRELFGEARFVSLRGSK